MNYVQRNPVPLPPAGPLARVHATLESVFDWEYALRQKELLGLYEKGKAATWNASELDWSTDVDIERVMHARAEHGVQRMLNEVTEPPHPLSREDTLQLELHQNAFMLSQFLHGEQGALLATAKIVQTVPSAEAKFYAANQVSDEARHVEVYHRYLTEKLCLSYEVQPSLGRLLDQILADSRWDVTYLGMQILVEGLALAAFGLVRLLMASEPLVVEITRRIMGDESRHVAFGVLSLERLYTEELSAAELREREDFVIEASELLRDRLLLTQVFERLGWDARAWTEWSRRTPFHRAFRQMTFSKIVPNLKRLGLLTPRVREAYARLDLLRFEHLQDSVEEPGVTPPEELARLLTEYLAPKPNAA